MKIKVPILLMTLALLSIGSIATSRATVLYSDTFSATAGTGLNGRTPDVTIGANTWLAGGWIMNGSNAATPLAGFDQAFLSFTPSAGNLYTLTADIQLGTSSGFNVYFGFSNTGLVDAGSHPYVIVYDDGTIDARTGGVSVGTTANGAPNAPHTYTMTLNTAPALWEVSWSFDGGPAFATYTYTTNPTIANLSFLTGLGADQPTIQVSNLSLDVVPEPSTLALGILGLGALLSSRRRRSA